MGLFCNQKSAWCVQMANQNKFKIIIASIISLLVLGFFIAGKTAQRSTVLKTNFRVFKADHQLDPATLKFVQEYFYLDNMTVKLVDLTSTGQYINTLAEKIVFSGDQTVIDIEIKQAFFSNGDPITIWDVEKSLKRATIFGAPHSNIKNLWLDAEKLNSINDDMRGIQITGEKSIRLTMKQPTKEILFFLSLTDLAILHPSQYNKDALLVSDWFNVTSGPYKLSVDKSGVFRLLANPKALTYSSDMPQEITAEDFDGDKILARTESQDLGLVGVTLADYFHHFDSLSKMKGYEIYGNQTDGITILILNLKSNQFKKESVRQWVNKRIIDSYEMDKRYEKSLRKAYQFFLPNAKGYIAEDKVKNILSNVDTKSIPEELKNGLHITSIKGMKDYLPDQFTKNLSRALGIPVTIDTSESSRNYVKLMRERKFDAFAISISMSYKVIGETLNLQYLSNDASFIDPTGKIKNLLGIYQKTDNFENEHEVISQVIEQMVKDSECVPLFYFASPYMINTDKFDFSQANLNETIQMWKVKVK